MSLTNYDVIRDAYDLVFAKTDEKVPFVVNTLKKYQVQSVLELGSGSGLFTLPIKEAGFNIEGLELSQEMISFMVQKSKNLTIHHGNIQNYQLNKQFDAVLMVSSILVLLDSHEAMEESLACSYAHLLPKGILFLELPNHSVEIQKSNHTQETYVSDDNATTVVIQSHTVEAFWREHWYIFRQNKKEFSQEHTICDEFLYSPKKLQSQLKKIGFEIIDTYGNLLGEPFDEKHSWRRVWVCQKK